MNKETYVLAKKVMNKFPSHLVSLFHILESNNVSLRHQVNYLSWIDFAADIYS